MSDPYENMGISEEDLEEKTDTESTSGEPGMEDFHGVGAQFDRISGSPAIPLFAADIKLQEEVMQRRMGHMPQQRRVEPLLIRTSDNTNYRVYMRSAIEFTQSYLNGMCRFLDSRVPGQTVTFVLGVKLMDWQAHILGGVVSAMIDCKAKVTTICAGYCGIAETMLWCFGKERLVYRYGALTFGHTSIVKACEAYKAFFDMVYQKALSIGVLTQEEADGLKNNGTELMLLYNEINERLNIPT